MVRHYLKGVRAVLLTSCPAPDTHTVQLHHIIMVQCCHDNMHSPGGPVRSVPEAKTLMLPARTATVLSPVM